jgi:hypothetical protein
LKTFENGVGPGQYELGNLNGAKLTNSQTKNVPSFSIGIPRLPKIVNPETRNIISSPH